MKGLLKLKLIFTMTLLILLPLFLLFTLLGRVVLVRGGLLFLLRRVLVGLRFGRGEDSAALGALDLGPGVRRVLQAEFGPAVRAAQFKSHVCHHGRCGSDVTNVNLTIVPGTAALRQGFTGSRP